MNAKYCRVTRTYVWLKGEEKRKEMLLLYLDLAASAAALLDDCRHGQIAAAAAT